jgi:hypothetical protein
MMDGSAMYSDLGTTAVFPAVDKDDDDDGVQLVATLVPVVATKAERVEVIAPASLPGGYELPCDFCGRSVVVRVVRRIGVSPLVSLLRICPSLSYDPLASSVDSILP